jgi:hypothetical protein
VPGHVPGQHRPIRWLRFGGGLTMVRFPPHPPAQRVNEIVQFLLAPIVGGSRSGARPFPRPAYSLNHEVCASWHMRVAICKLVQGACLLHAKP